MTIQEARKVAETIEANNTVGFEDGMLAYWALAYSMPLDDAEKANDRRLCKVVAKEFVY